MDGKKAIDYSDEVLDEQFEYYTIMQNQTVKSVQVVSNLNNNLVDGPAVLMLMANESK